MTFDNSQLPDYTWADLNWLKYEIDMNLDSVKESISFNENLIINKKEWLQSAIDADELLNSDEPEEVKAQYHDQKYHFMEDNRLTLEVVLYNSTFLTLFAIYEGMMKKLCQSIESRIKSTVKHTDLQNGGKNDQFQKYFLLVVGMNLTDSGKYHNQIVTYKTIRNKIAHEKNQLTPEALSMFKAISNLKLNNENQIVVSSPLLNDLITLMEHYFKALFFEIDIRMANIMISNKEVN